MEEEIKHIRESRLMDGKRNAPPFHLVLRVSRGDYCVEKFFPEDKTYEYVAGFSEPDQGDRCFDLRLQQFESWIGYKASKNNDEEYIEEEIIEPPSREMVIPEPQERKKRGRKKK